MTAMRTPNPQLDDQGNLKHFLTIEGLSREILTEILDQAEGFLGVAQQAVKKVPLCRGKVIANLFFENSTRTRTTFELAAKRLSADVLNLNISTSSTSKGETLLDTLRTLVESGQMEMSEAFDQDNLATILYEAITPVVG